MAMPHATVVVAFKILDYPLIIVNEEAATYQCLDTAARLMEHYARPLLLRVVGPATAFAGTLHP